MNCFAIFIQQLKPYDIRKHKRQRKLTKEGENIKNKYTIVILFFFIFLIVLTSPVSIKAINSFVQTERIAKDVEEAINAYFKANCKPPILIRNLWIKKHDFRIGGPEFYYGFEYNYEGLWREYSDPAGGEDYIYISLSNQINCIKNDNKLVYDDTEKRIVIEDENKNYDINVWIWGSFERGLLLIYSGFIFIIDLLISIIWAVVIFVKAKK